MATLTMLLASIIWMAVERSTAVQATSMTATTYDDGKSCPGNCDAHVVFHPSHNGTLNAFDPSTGRSAHAKCVAGRPCTICFTEAETSCMVATYRGAGPPKGRFDFTPTFFEENCATPVLPTPVAAKCQSAQAAIKRLEGLVNCIEDQSHEKCRATMEAAKAKKAADDLLFDECRSLGETAFNKKHAATPHMQRSIACAYELHGTGRNSAGVTWKRLLDGACRAGTFAGRDGLDCCSGSLFAAALLGRECRPFFAEK
jgi:hypothetical protein